MDLFATLEKKQKRTGAFNAGMETRFYLDHFSLLNTIPNYKWYYRAQKPFDILRANIILRGLLNKKILDDAFQNAARPYHGHMDSLTPTEEANILMAVNEAKQSLDSFVFKNTTIYIPVLPRSFNEIYDKDVLSLDEKPFKALRGRGMQAVAIDPFDAYGYEVFDSDFTNLILIKKTPRSAAFFDYDASNVYFVNEQGRCDATLCLFDRYLGKRNTNHMMERIIPVVDAYYRDDEEEFRTLLVQNQLISSRLMYKISSDDSKRFRAIDRIAEK